MFCSVIIQARDAIMNKDPEDRSVVNFCLDHLSDRICGDLIAVESILIIGQSTFINTRYKKLPERGVMEIVLTALATLFESRNRVHPT